MRREINYFFHIIRFIYKIYLQNRSILIMFSKYIYIFLQYIVTFFVWLSKLYYCYCFKFHCYSRKKKNLTIGTSLKKSTWLKEKSLKYSIGSNNIHLPYQCSEFPSHNLSFTFTTVLLIIIIIIIAAKSPSL